MAVDSNIWPDLGMTQTKKYHRRVTSNYILYHYSTVLRAYDTNGAYSLATILSQPVPSISLPVKMTASINLSTVGPLLALDNCDDEGDIAFRLWPPLLVECEGCSGKGGEKVKDSLYCPV